MKKRLAAGPLFLVAAGCASPLGGQDLDLSVGASALPGLGGLVGLSQRIWQGEDRRVDFEMELVHQELEDPGPQGDDDWDQIRGGLLLRSADPGPSWIARGGGVWLRSQGETSVLDDAGDYGGLYLGAGLDFPVGTSLRSGPDLSLLFVDAEGSRGGSGVVVELAWRLTWRL